MVPTVDKLPFYDDLFAPVNQKTNLAVVTQQLLTLLDSGVIFSEAISENLS
jgi:type II secretory pathway component PulF